MNFKKILLTAACALLLVAPTVIAVATYRNAQKQPVVEGAVTKMELCAPGGKIYQFDKTAAQQPSDQIDNDTIAFFIAMNKNATAVPELPAPVAAKSSYRATYYSYDIESVFTYYFDTDPTAAYYKDAAGNAYHISLADATKFVYSPYAVALYKDASLPVLNVSGNAEQLLPKTANWYYQLSNGTFTGAPLETTSTRQSIHIAGELNISFASDPDYLHVQVFDGDKQLYNDTYTNLGALTFTENATLNVILQAKWYDEGNGSAYGEAYYDFDVSVQAPPIFTLGESEIEFGEFVVISGKNVLDPSSVSFSSEPAIDFEPVFFQDGNYVRALVPIAYTWKYSPTYSFTLSCDGVTSTLNLSVTKKTFRAQGFDASTELIAKYGTEAAFNDFAEKTLSYLLNQENTCYFRSALFTQPVANPSIRTGFGLYRTLLATGKTYRHEGVDFVLASGGNVQAACDGVVIFAGSTQLSGRTVIIDHGCGLKTLYAHLSSVGVAEGQVVKTGDVIGFAGDTGFTTGNVLHFGTYVFDIPVCPYSAFETSIIMPRG